MKNESFDTETGWRLKAFCSIICKNGGIYVSGIAMKAVIII